MQLLDWSYQLLDPVEQAVFQTLGVFMESFGLDEVQAALGDPQLDELDIAEIVWRLVDKSLVQNDRRNGASRYRLLETVRAAADGYIESAGKASTVRARLARHYFEAFPFELRGNRTWLSRLALEQATIRRLADELLGDDQYELASALARVGAEHLLAGTSPREGLSELLAFVARVPDTNGLARLHATIAKELTNRSDLTGGSHAPGHGRPPRRPVRRRRSARTGHVVEREGDDRRARGIDRHAARRPSATSASTLAASVSDAQRADLLLDLAIVGSALDDGSVLPALEEAAVLAERIEDHVGHMFVLNNLAECELRLGAVPSAARHQSEAMRLSAELGNRVVTAFGLVLAARIAQPARARRRRRADARRRRRPARRRSAMSCCPTTAASATTCSRPLATPSGGASSRPTRRAARSRCSTRSSWPRMSCAATSTAPPTRSRRPDGAGGDSVDRATPPDRPG